MEKFLGMDSLCQQTGKDNERWEESMSMSSIYDNGNGLVNEERFS